MLIDQPQHNATGRTAEATQSAPGTDQRLYADQLHLRYGAMSIALIAIVVDGAILVAAQWSYIAHGILLGRPVRFCSLTYAGPRAAGSRRVTSRFCKEFHS